MSIVDGIIKKIEEDIDTLLHPAARPHQEGNAEKEEKPSDRNSIRIESENMAMPEIHTGRVKNTIPETDTSEIPNDTLAIPEIHATSVREKMKKTEGNHEPV